MFWLVLRAKLRACSSCRPHFLAKFGLSRAHIFLRARILTRPTFDTRGFLALFGALDLAFRIDFWCGFGGKIAGRTRIWRGLQNAKMQICVWLVCVFCVLSRGVIWAYFGDFWTFDVNCARVYGLLGVEALAIWLWYWFVRACGLIGQGIWLW